MVLNAGARALAVAATVAVAACSPGAEEGVLPDSPPEGEVVDLEFDSEAVRLLRAHAHAVYQSSDGGVTWQPIPLPSSVAHGRIADVATASGAENVIYVAGPGIGVWRSEDEGRSWIALNDGLPGTAVTSFSVHAAQSGTIYAVVEAEGIYRSEDAGVGWTRMDAGPGADIREFLHSGMEGSMQTGWLFAATEEGVRRSMDCFCGWRPTGELPGGPVYDVAYDPRQPERVYAATAGGLFASEDGGETWTRTSGDGPAVIVLAVDPSGTLYAATNEGALLRSADLGRSWARTGA